eukprot:CAMPEP_0206165622 /NCGR_PEP_ID=MMETSP1474-20131121/21015_1 /ASSEMBLY_ACC=CAM_ASM_001110 /TAXON_ID=97495 /ORGANISM="Imantonia sp., Strain RCC918" /LENGTH=101 /DNA_ID=CAMNT_0053569127 /DNA_START=78 /DNA_END=382 /DNA_ORIENTATION=-
MSTAVNSVLFSVGLKDEVTGTGVFAGAVKLKREPRTGLLGSMQGEAADAAGTVLFALAAGALIVLANSFDAAASLVVADEPELVAVATPTQGGGARKGGSV